MAASNPERKIGLVTFENVVEVVGDGIEKPISISHDLDNYDDILAQGL